MLDENIRLEDYFKEEVKRVSDIEIQQIETEISSIRERFTQQIEQDAQHIAGVEHDQEVREMQSEHAIAVSKIHEETNRELMEKRRELANSIFQEAVQQIMDFVCSEEYAYYLMKKVSVLAAQTYGHVVFYVRDEDKALLPAICKAYGNCDGFVDPDIKIGGFRMECPEKGIAIDETFDTGIDEQKSWFYTNSGLNIK